MVLIAAPSMLASIAQISGAPIDDIGAPVTAMTPEDAKGLEFDAVLVVEPSAIVEQAGLRLLYIAITRAMRHLMIVHSHPLPESMRATARADVA